MLSDSKITVQIHLFQLRMGQPMVTYMSTKQKLENLAQGFPGCDNIFHNTGDNSRTSSQISTTKTQPQQLQKSCLFEEGGYNYKTEETSMAPLAHSKSFPQ